MGSSQESIPAGSQDQSLIRLHPVERTSSSASGLNFPKKQARNNPNLKHESSSDRKFNIVIYGLKESSKGIPRHNRICNDVQSVSETIKSLCPELTEQAVCDCIRLGKYKLERTLSLSNLPVRVMQVTFCQTGKNSLNSQMFQKSQ